MSLKQVDVILFSDVSNSIGFGRYAGPYRVATELRSAGFEVLVIDFFSDFTFDQLIKVLDLYISEKTLFVGFATTLMAQASKNKSQNPYGNDYTSISDWQKGLFAHSDEFMQRLFAYIRRLSPKIQIVVGGTKAVKGGIPNVDWWVWGEADKSIIALAQHLSSGTPIKSSSSDGSSKRILSEDYPFTDFCHSQIVWTERDLVFQNEILPIEISRGCIFNCSFCTFKNRGKKLSESIKSPETLYIEMERNYRLFGTNEYLFSDDTFNDSLEKIKEIIKVKNRLGFDLKFSTFCRLDMITRHPEMIDLLMEAGLKCVNFGIESFNETALKQAHKYTFPVEKIKQTLFDLKEKWKDQIVVTANFIVGLPGEPEESIFQTVDWLSADQGPIDSFNLLPLFVVPKYGDANDKTAILTNKLGEQPEKYKLMIDSQTGYWKHEFMDKNRAIQLVNELESNPRVKRKTTVNRSGFYGRLKNIGFSHEDCVSDIVKNVSSEEFSERRKVLFEYYFSVLIAGESKMPSVKDIFRNYKLNSKKQTG